MTHMHLRWAEDALFHTGTPITLLVVAHQKRRLWPQLIEMRTDKTQKQVWRTHAAPGEKSSSLGVGPEGKKQIENKKSFKITKQI